MDKTELFEFAKLKLNTMQLDVLKECIDKKSGGLSLCLGSGKTLTSLVLGLSYNNGNPMLVVVSKTLIESWKYEIEKFFGDKLKYQVLHQDSCKIETCEIKSDTLLVITTIDVISKFYKKCNISDYFINKKVINQGQFNQHIINEYKRPTVPFINIKSGAYTLFSIEWSCLIIDEVQKFTMVTSNRCQGIASICCKNRWALSGTMFDEPKTERILGYYLIINYHTFPRTLPDAEIYLRSRNFKGFAISTVHRGQNTSYIAPEINQQIIVHDLTKEETLLYYSMRETMKDINKKLITYQEYNDIENVRKFGSYLLAMITYLRQSIVCPIIPIAKALVDVADLTNKSELSKTLLDNIKNSNLTEWLNDENSIKSSRIKNILEIIDKHKEEKLVVFTCFRTCLDVLKYCIPSDRTVFALTSTMTSKSRGNTIEKFKETSNGILLLTYELGAEGLNLQFACTVLLVDVWWNDGKTQQAIGRVLRFGQISKIVNIYFFTSNTGIEKAVFNKHEQKLTLLEELKVGPMLTKVKKIVMKELIDIIDKEDNKNLLSKIITKNINN